jgi:hypothetical protein
MTSTHDERSDTPRPTIRGLLKLLGVLLLPAGSLAVALGVGIHYLFDRETTTAELSSSLPYVLAVFSLLYVGAAVLLSVAHFRSRACIVPRNELVGRLAGWSAGRATVELVGRDGEVVDRATLVIDSDGYRALGGDGGRIRAWRDPGTRWTEIQAVPSLIA